MAGRSVNVDLRIKAQDEASKALESVGKALKDLAGADALAGSGSNGVAKFLETLGKNAKTLAAENEKLERSQRGVTQSFDTGVSQLRKANQALQQRRRDAEQLAKALADLDRVEGTYKNRQAKNFIGPLPSRPAIGGKTALDSTLRKQYDELTGTIEKQERTVASLRQKILQATEASAQNAASQTTVKSAIAATTAEIEKQTERLSTLAEIRRRDAQVAASRQVQSRVNATTGVTGLRATDTANGQNVATFSALAAREDAVALKQAADAHAAFEARVKSGADELRRSADAMRKEEAAVASLADEINEMKRDFDRAAYAQAFLERETKKLDRALKTVDATTGKTILNQKEYVKALESVRRKSEQLGEQSNPQLFGLNPYQTQNLLFQFNDIATQLASGTSLSQTLAQQGGQILQLFPKVGNSIVTNMRVGGAAIAGVAVALGAIVLGIKSAADQAERLRGFGGLLAGIGTEGGSSVESINDAARAIDRYGLSAEEAIAVTRKLVREGFDATQIEMFAKTAKDMADVLGIEVGAAVDLLTGAYTGNLESLRRLMDETDAFTPAQRNLIESMYSSGDAAGAFDKAFAILSANMNEGARLARGPWTEAFRNLGNAWDDLVEQLGNTWWAKAALEGVNALAAGLDWLTGKTDEARRAEEARQGAFSNGGYAADPLAGSVSPYSTPQVAGGKTGREDVGTANQQATAAKLTKEAEREAILAKKVTSEKILQQKLDVIATIEREKLGNSVTKQVQDTLVQAKIAKERITLEKELADYKKQQATSSQQAKNAEEASLKAYVARVVKVESNGQADAKNPNSTATGAGQFIESTWLNLFRKYYPKQAETMGRDAILELRKDSGVSKALIEAYARENAAVLRKAGAAVTEANLYLAHFLGPDGAAKVLRANPNASIASVLGGTRGGQAAIAANPTILGGNATAGSVQRFAQRRFPGAKASSVDQAILEGEDALADIADKRAEREREYAQTFNDRLSGEERSIANQKELVGLQGAELRAAIERQQIEEALAQALQQKRQKLDDPNATLTQAETDRITVTVRAKLKLDEPSKVAADLQKQVSDLESRKGILQANLTQKQQEGDTGGMRDVQRQIEDIDARIAEAAQTYLDFLNTPGNADALGLYGVELDNMISKMEQLSQKTAEWKLTIGSATITASEFANAFTNTAVSALDQFAQAIASGKDAFGSLWDAFRQFAADFLIQIAQMIQKQIIFNLVSGLLKGLAAGLGGGFGSASSINSSALGSLRGTVLHEGGVVGVGGTFRSVSPEMFANATRYHSGGIAGLKPGEVPSILMKGEEVLTRDDPRHMLNGGGGAGGNVKIVNAFDVGDAVSKGMETKAGEKAILNLVRNNPRAFRAAMGS